VLEPVIALVVLAAAIAAVTFREWFPTHANVLNRELAMAPRSAIRRIRGGVVAVSGHARTASARLVAPLSGRACLAYQITICERMAYGWDVVGRFGQAEAFWVEDQSGRALVDPGEHFALTLVKFVTTLSDGDESTRAEAVRKLAAERGVAISRAHELRFEEGILEEGELVAVAGHASKEAHPRGEAEGPRRLPICLVLRGNGFGKPLLVSDDPRANRR
jgi:hypothetical protein